MRLKEREENVSTADANRSEAETRIVSMREERTKLEGVLNDAQGKFYAVGADITRIEQSIQHARDEREKRALELKRIEEETTEIKANIETDEKRIEEAQIALAEADPRRQEVEREQQAATQRYEQAESTYQETQSAWEELSSVFKEQETIVQVETAKQSQLDKNAGQLKVQQERLQREKGELQSRTEDSQLNALTAQQSTKGAEEAALRVDLGNAKQALTDTREKVRRSEEALDSKRTQLQADSGRFAALQALQQSATGGSEKGRIEWLEKHGLADAKPLAKLLDIDEGWEAAIEVVLGDFLDAICVDDIDSLQKTMTAPPEAGLNILQDNVDDQVNLSLLVMAFGWGGTGYVCDPLTARVVCCCASRKSMSYKCLWRRFVVTLKPQSKTTIN